MCGGRLGRSGGRGAWVKSLVTEETSAGAQTFREPVPTWARTGRPGPPLSLPGGLRFTRASQTGPVCHSGATRAGAPARPQASWTGVQ